MNDTKTRFIFVTGGVVSSLGKGIASAALASLLQARGYKLRIRKLDPYLNVDPGTMSPYQHGEVFVTDDGAETDLDLGHYERFTGVDARKSDNVTAGRIYQTVLQKERRGDYLGGTVQVIPHVTNEIKSFATADLEDLDFIICEIGGTVGDIEGLPFFEAIRQLGQELGRERAMFIHLTLLPYITAAGELKTKPTQHSVKECARSASSLTCWFAVQTGHCRKMNGAKLRFFAMFVLKQLLMPLMCKQFMKCRCAITKLAWTAKCSAISGWGNVGWNCRVGKISFRPSRPQKDPFVWQLWANTPTFLMPTNP